MLFNKIAMKTCFIELAGTLLFNISTDIVFKIILLPENESYANY